MSILDESLRRYAGPFPNYNRCIMEYDTHELVSRYMLEGRYLTDMYNIPDNIAHTSCPVCGADLYPTMDGVFSAYRCKCKTYICEVGPVRCADLIVIYFDIAITEFKLIEDII